MIFVPDNTIKIISIGIPILLDIFALISNFIFTNKLQSAANLRNYFDAKVLMINEDEYTQLEKQKIRELALHTCQKNQSDAISSLHNTGRDIPPGVRNWYEFKRDIDGIDAQYECQSQNIWWNKKMIQKRIICLSMVGVLLTFFFIIMFIIFKSDIFSIISCSIGIILKIIERVIEHYNYHVISIKIETIQKHIENKLTTDNIKKLQLLINERRNIPVLEINFIHRKKAKELSDLYRNIS